MQRIDRALEELRSYSSTSWENGGPGESCLVSNIRTALAEIERLQAERDDLQQATQVAVIDPLRAEIKGLRLVLEKAKSVANFWSTKDATIDGVPARVWNLQRAIEAVEPKTMKEQEAEEE